jgi:hypothetical protein
MALGNVSPEGNTADAPVSILAVAENVRAAADQPKYK